MLDGVCLYKKLVRRTETGSFIRLHPVFGGVNGFSDTGWRRDGANAITGMWKRRGSRKETSKNEMK
jgi:hypothetical protein